MIDKSTKSYLEAGDLSHITTYQAGIIQASVHRTLQKYSDQVLSQYGITKMHWLIIGTVLDAGENGIRLTELAELLGTTMGYITNSVNLLESRGFLVRKDNSKDNRSKRIFIESEFAPKCQEIENALRNALRQKVYSHVDPIEFRTYIKVLYQLANNDR